MAAVPADRPQELSFEFDDFEAFNLAARGWSLNFRQVDRGTAKVGLRHRMTAEINAMDVRFTHSTKSFGAPQAGHRTFGMVGQGVGCTWCGYDAAQQLILRFDAHDEFDTFTPSGFLGRTLSVEENLLDAIATRLGFGGFVERLDRGQDVLNMDPLAMDRFCRIYDAPIQNGGDLQSIVESLIILIENDRAPSRPASSPNAAQLVDAALAFMLEHARDAITVAGVCEQLGIGYRPLDRAFRERLGHGPKQSIQAIRLNGVRRELRSAPPTARVADIANGWGFWHLGDFARIYRQEFGELPSGTLQRAA